MKVHMSLQQFGKAFFNYLQKFCIFVNPATFETGIPQKLSFFAYYNMKISLSH